jgi:hypothetical protein
VNPCETGRETAVGGDLRTAPRRAFSPGTFVAGRTWEERRHESGPGLLASPQWRTCMAKFLETIKSMRWTSTVVAFGLLALVGGLLLTKIKPTIILALVGFYFGIASAYYWWRSGRVSYKRGPSVIRFGQIGLAPLSWRGEVLGSGYLV